MEFHIWHASEKPMILWTVYFSDLQTLAPQIHWCKYKKTRKHLIIRIEEYGVSLPPIWYIMVKYSLLPMYVLHEQDILSTSMSLTSLINVTVYFPDWKLWPIKQLTLSLAIITHTHKKRHHKVQDTRMWCRIICNYCEFYFIRIIGLLLCSLIFY